MARAISFASVVAAAVLSPATAVAGFEYITHWNTYNGKSFNGPTDVSFLKSNGNLVVSESNAGVTTLAACSGNDCASGAIILQPDGTYVGRAPNAYPDGPDNRGVTRSATDPNSGDVYVTTYYDGLMFHYTESGGTLTLANTWDGCTANGGVGPYTFGKLFGVAVDSTGAVYVNDYDNLRVVKMNSAGQCLANAITTYTKDAIPGQTFLNLTGVAVDSADNLWVSDYGKKIVVKYDSAGTWQTTLTGFTNCGATTPFSSPKDIDVDPVTDEIFINDSGANLGIIKLDSSGNFLTKTSTYNTNTALSVNFGGGYTSGFYYETDYGHSAVVKFQNPTRKVAVTASAGGTVSADVGGLIAGATGGNTCADQFVDNTTVVLTATPDSGYGVSWGGDGGSCTGNTCTLANLAANKSVTATFTLLAVPGVCGGDDGQTLVVTPTNLCASGTPSSVTEGPGSYSWNCLGTNGSLVNDSCSATRDYIVTPSAGANGTIDPSAPVQVAYNATPNFTVTADGGYVASISGTCGGALAGTTYTTDAVSADCTVAASFIAENDGVDSTTENGAPNNGDGNGDGTQDSQQTNVTSLLRPDGGYLTIQTSCPAGLTNVQTYTEASQGGGDAQFNMPYGLVGFSAACESAQFTVYYHGLNSVAGMTYRKYGPTIPGNASTLGWYTLPNVTFGTVTIDGQTVATATFSLNDNQLGDDTGDDGLIVDQGGVSNGAVIPSIPTLSEWGMALLSGLLALGMLTAIRRQPT